MLKRDEGCDDGLLDSWYKVVVFCVSVAFNVAIVGTSDEIGLST